MRRLEKWVMEGKTYESGRSECTVIAIAEEQDKEWVKERRSRKE